MTVVIGVVLFFVFVFCLVSLRGAPYIPTHKASLRVLFDDLLALSSDDTLVDIGCGDGVVLRAAARHGARAVGYEINPVLVLVAKILSWRYGRQVQVRLADFWLTKFPDETTVVYTFGESRDIQKMYDKVQSESTRLGKTLQFVSYGFEIKSLTPTRQSSAMTVYEVLPLQ